MHEQAVKRTCLNGWWDILPVYDTPEHLTIPATGWLEGQYLVPSFWTKSQHAVRKSGETYYDANRDPRTLEGGYEFLLDGFGYPPEWSKTRSSWVRRHFTCAPQTGKRYELVFDAVMPWTRLYINGNFAAKHYHPTLPMRVDVTDWLVDGENEIAVYIEDYERDPKGRALTPTGNLIPCDHSGIWQDVWLIERSEVTLSDITIRTSTREASITLIYSVTNHTDHGCDIALATDIREWVKGIDVEEQAVVRALPAKHLHVPATCTVGNELTIPWPDAVWWSPENPQLYHARTELREGDTVLEVSAERFGFREVWIEGKDIMLNDHPVHLFSDWGHKSTPYYYTEGWIRQWFAMLRDANMNHSRLHTHPHPPVTLDIADEMGILITGEAGLHGSGGAQAGLSPEYWERAQDHVRRFVKRDKNHPSVILWSVENEMRWNTKGEDAAAENEMIQIELPKLRATFNAMDPTRVAYHDGDSSLWNEAAQPIISRHYGKECAGIGWWDEKRPLHSGEMSFYHYAGPNNTLHLGGDSVYASFKAIDLAAAEDTALIIETGRTLGVSCFGPWNLSCLENLRMVAEDVKLSYADFTSPGVKPLQVPAHSSEFTFWTEGKGYTPNHSFDIQKHAFRPAAVIDRSRRSTYFTDIDIHREVFVVNDTPTPMDALLEISLTNADGALVTALTFDIRLDRGYVARVDVPLATADSLLPGLYVYAVALVKDDVELDEWTRTLRVSAPVKPGPFDLPGSLTLVGTGQLRSQLERWGIRVTVTDTLTDAVTDSDNVLVLERNSVQPGSQQARIAHHFVQRGGRLIVLEQTTSLFPSISLEPKPVLKAFVRAPHHSVMAGFDDKDFAYWGDDPYPLLASDAYVARYQYRKGDGSQLLPLLDSGEGGFGSGDLELTPLFEAREGDGLVLACQLRISDKLGDIPAAERLLLALLKRANAFSNTLPESYIVLNAGSVDDPAPFVNSARKGTTVIVNNLTKAHLMPWSLALGVDLLPVNPGEVYQAVRIKDDPLLDGVSNADTCGIETWSYAHNAENNTLGDLFLAPVAGIDVLLATPTESCLRELFVYHGRSEQLRAHTLSRFLHAEKRLQAVVVARIPVGKGAVILNQFNPPKEKRDRFNRLQNRMIANLGHRFIDGLFKETAGQDKNQTSSPGYPQQVYTMNRPLTDDLLQQMIDSTRPTLERMLSMPILTLAEWHVQEDNEGVWCAKDLDLTQGVALYYPVWSPAPRKNIDTNLDVPNPEALTFMDVEGCGEVTVYINGRLFAHGSLDEGQLFTVSDIDLEMGGNHALVLWRPAEAEATLRMVWRNIMHTPETGLTFGRGGAVD